MNHALYLTATKVSNWQENGDHDEAHGWVSPNWSMTTLFDNMEDVAPVSVYELDANDDETFAEWLARNLSDTLGSYEDGNRSFYATDSVSWDYTTDEDYHYAMHLMEVE